MDYFLFALALVLLLSAGLGVTSFLASERDQLGPGETAALTFLFGATFISLVSFLLGFVLSGLVLRLVVAISTGCLGIIGVRRISRHRSVRLKRPRGRDWLWCGVLILQSLIVFWLSLRLSLGFDGLFLWEAKARLIFVSGGGIAPEYIRANQFEIAHPYYPLFLPFVESWFYGFLGRPHQGWLKLVLPLFYVAAVGLLARNRLNRSYLPAVMLFFVPVFLIRVTSGEADFPLAVFYLGASLYFLDYLKTGNSRLLLIAGAFAAVLPWVKREGAILFAVLMIVGAVRFFSERSMRNLIVLAAPGLLWLGFWRLFLAVVGAPDDLNYFPATPRMLIANVSRIPEIAREASREFFRWRMWSILWMVPLRGFLNLKQCWVWMLLTLSPLMIYAAIYIFSAWVPWLSHLHASYSRLMTHVALVALLGLGSSPPAAPLFALRGEERPLPDASAP